MGGGKGATEINGADELAAPDVPGLLLDTIGTSYTSLMIDFSFSFFLFFFFMGALENSD